VLIDTVLANQQVNGGLMNLLNTYNLTAGTLDIVLSNNANGYVIADAVQVTYDGPTGNFAPNSTIDSPSGDISINIGESINFTGTGNDPDGNIPLAYLWQFGASGIADSSSEDPGLLTFNTAGVFSVTFTVSDSSGLADPAPAQVVVTVNDPAGTQIADNGEANYVTQGPWGTSNFTPGYYGADYNSIAAGTGADTATWSFSLAQDGQYSISSQWTSGANRATNATYTVYNNGNLVGTALVDQSIDGGAMNLLGNFDLASGTVDIVLDNNANGYVIADAVQVVYEGPAGNLPPNSSIDTPSGNIMINAGDSINFTGSGSDPDGGTSFTYFWQFDVGSGIADMTVEDPGLVTFNNLGQYTISFTVTDIEGAQDPSPAIVTVNVVSVLDGVIVDNTDPGFNSVGPWTSSSAIPGFYGSDYLYANSGVGDTMSSWTFNIAADGSYDIYAKWIPADNRASNANYTILNNGIIVDTLIENQRVIDGAFELLGSYSMTAGDVTVELNNIADGLVIADAVRLCAAGNCPEQTIISPGENNLLVDNSVTVLVQANNIQTSWGVEFVLNGDDVGSIKDYVAPYEQTYNLVKDEYTVETFYVDSSGTRLDAYYDVVNFGVGDYYVAFGDSITRGSGDDNFGDNNSADGRDSGPGYQPRLNDLLTTARAYPHTIKNTGVSGDHSLDGAARIDSVLSANPKSQYFLIMFGTNDSIGDRASGLGLTAGDVGFANSYKDYMMQILDAVVAAGKTPYLAKVPYTLLADPQRNELIQEYNLVVDELVITYSIPVVPPDFYVHFEANQDQFADLLHPNGTGYAAMSTLWENAIAP
jgi:lysophospholipase L1-like esterase